MVAAEAARPTRPYAAAASCAARRSLQLGAPRARWLCAHPALPNCPLALEGTRASGPRAAERLLGPKAAPFAPLANRASPPALGCPSTRLPPSDQTRPPDRDSAAVQLRASRLCRSAEATAAARERAGAARGSVQPRAPARGAARARTGRQGAGGSGRRRAGAARRRHGHARTPAERRWRIAPPPRLAGPAGGAGARGARAAQALNLAKDRPAPPARR
jgi:hypothetical protein